MNLIKFSVKRPVTLVMIVCCVLVLGVVSFSGLSINLMPDVNFPGAVVSTSYQGAGPAEIENLITKPLESALSTVSNFKSVTSDSSNGQSQIVVNFTQGTDMDFATLNMREKIDLVKDTLPEGASAPFVMQFDPAMMPFGVYTVTDTNSSDLEKVKSVVDNKIVNRLESIEGVAQVQVAGGLEKKISVEIIPERLGIYGLTLDQISSGLRSENLTLPGGKIDEGGRSYTLRTTAEYADIEDIKNVSFKTQTGTVRLGDIATVKDDFKDVEGQIFQNEIPSIGLSIQKQSTANTVEVSNKLIKEFEAIKKDLPNIEFKTIMDQADYIRLAIDSVTQSALIGGLLAILILFLFLGNMKTTLIVGISIPISIVATFVLIYFSNVTLNMMTLGGLALGVGMLVDNSIVVLESIYRYREDGYSKKDSAIKGTKEVAAAVTSSTLTTIVVFLPIIFIKDNMAMMMFRELAMTVTFSLIASLVVALTLVPMLSSKLIDTKRGGENGKFSLTNKINGTFKKVELGYKKVLIWALGRKKRLLAGSFALLVISAVTLFSLTGFEFMPAEEQGMFSISITLPEGAGLSESTKYAELVTEKIRKVEAETVSTDYIVTQNYVGNSMVMVSFGDKKHRGSHTSAEITEKLLNETSTIAGASINVSENSSMGMGISMGGGGGGQISINVKGEELDKLEELANDIKVKLNEIEGVRQVSTSFDKKVPQVSVKFNREAASNLGVSATTVARAVQGAVMGQTATQLREDGDEVDIMLQFNKETVDSIEKLNALQISTNTGAFVPLATVADVEMVDTPKTITRIDQVRYGTISGAISGRTASDVFNEINKKVVSMPVDDGYSIEMAGESEELSKTLNGFLVAILMAMILVYMIMAAQFEKYVHPLVIMFTLPLAFIGVALALLLSHKAMSVPALIGVVVLIGVVLNNAIVLVDYINELKRRDGLSTYDAILIAGPVRLRPILMTTLTTVLGLVPLSLGLGDGSQLQQPMAISIIGGLLFSTLLTLIIIPIIYTLMDKKLKQPKKLLLAQAEALTLAEGGSQAVLEGDSMENIDNIENIENIQDIEDVENVENIQENKNGAKPPLNDSENH